MLFFDDNGDEDIDIYIYIVGRIDRMMRMYEYVCMCVCNNSDNQSPPTRTPKNSLKDIRRNEEEKTEILGESEREGERKQTKLYHQESEVDV